MFVFDLSIIHLFTHPFAHLVLIHSSHTRTFMRTYTRAFICTPDDRQTNKHTHKHTHTHTHTHTITTHLNLASLVRLGFVSYAHHHKTHPDFASHPITYLGITYTHNTHTHTHVVTHTHNTHNTHNTHTHNTHTHTHIHTHTTHNTQHTWISSRSVPRASL